MEEIVQKQDVADLQTSSGSEEKKDKLLAIDFKMVTFSLAGKDYAVDIMNVKEIAKGGHFTYVPNTAPFVLGVYNLRGEIIPIIDLRLFFNIEIPAKKNNEIENMIVLTVEDKVFGVIVDGIDKVVGIQKSSIQPPHPLFGDINIKYIYGVVESNSRLYVLLDVDRIFTNKPREDAVTAVETAAQNNLNAVHAMSHQKAIPEGKSINDMLKGSFQGKQILSEKAEPAKSVPVEKVTEAPKKEPEPPKQDVDFSFIKDGLSAHKKFYVTDLNSQWTKQRIETWAKERGSATIQITNESDAESFLQGFYSPCTGTFWSESYADAVYAALPDNTAKQIVVWNPGCGKGFESYSLACLLKKRYPNSKIKLFAEDLDLLNISNASLLSVPDDIAKEWMAPYLTKNVSGGYTFTQEIKDMVLFEYHDCSHTNSVPSPDIILCRDMLSFIPEDVQGEVLSDFEERLKGNGILILGENESLDVNWSENLIGNICVYSK